MATVPAEAQGPSDAELIDAVRKGTLSAYGSLYERHVASAYHLARQLTRSQAEADDLVSEAFAKVLDTLKAGRGPDSAFRAYLLTALRHTAYDKTRRERRVELHADLTDVSTSWMSAEAVSASFTDPAVAGLERSLAAQAFARLPERWQAVLWHTEIEGQSPSEVAPLLGLTPNGVSALAYRAREGLKQAYLQVYLADTTEQRCRATTDRLGAWTRDGLSKREKAQVEAHLDGCQRCRTLAAELADVNGAMRVFIAPLVLGSGTLGYLATAGAATKSAITGGAIMAGAGTASAPRQFLGVTAAAAVLVAAIALALAAGGGGQEIPQAARPAAPASPPGSPTASPPASPSPSNPPPTQSPAPQPPTSPTPQPQPAPPSPQPGLPSLDASPPDMPISLIAAGAAADLPITVRNTGGGVSGPVQATLALPAGVTAIPSGPSRFAGTPLLRLDAPALTRGQPTAGTVFCPGGTGSVRCGTGTGLQPGESVTLLFRLVASAGSRGGEITGTVSDGGPIFVRITVRVVVRPPATVDGVAVLAKAEWFDTLLPGLLGKRLVHVIATNTGTSTKPIAVTVDRDGLKLSSSLPVNCVSHRHVISCTTAAGVAPGGVVKLSFKLNAGLLGLHCQAGPITVTATLGSAKDHATLHAECWTLLGLPPNGTTPPRTSSPPVRPHPQPPVVKPVSPPSPNPQTTTQSKTKPQPPPVEQPPPAPLPQVETPVTTPSPGTPFLPRLLGWLLPG